jgi:anti-sigma B factor antagonist
MQMRDVGFAVEVIRGAPVVVTPEEIDITNAAGLRAALLQAALLQEALLQEAGHGRGTFVVDMTRTRFCDSAGIHALVDAHKRARDGGGQMLLAVAGTSVPRIFEITGIDRAVPRFPSLEEALDHIPAAEAPGPASLGA